MEGLFDGEAELRGRGRQQSQIRRYGGPQPGTVGVGTLARYLLDLPTFHANSTDETIQSVSQRL